MLKEPLAAALRIPEQLTIRAEHRVLVLGDGRLGNLSAQVIAGLGCEVIVIGKHLKKLQRLDQLGIETCLRVAAQPDRSADIVVDCTGSSSGFADALKWVKPLGTVVLKTTVAGDSSVFLAPIVIDEVTVQIGRAHV